MQISILSSIHVYADKELSYWKIFVCAGNTYSGSFAFSCLFAAMCLWTATLDSGVYGMGSCQNLQWGTLYYLITCLYHYLITLHNCTAVHFNKDPLLNTNWGIKFIILKHTKCELKVRCCNCNNNCCTIIISMKYHTLIKNFVLCVNSVDDLNDGLSSPRQHKYFTPYTS